MKYLIVSLLVLLKPNQMKQSEGGIITLRCMHVTVSRPRGKHSFAFRGHEVGNHWCGSSSLAHYLNRFYAFSLWVEKKKKKSFYIAYSVLSLYCIFSFSCLSRRPVMLVALQSHCASCGVHVMNKNILSSLKKKRRRRYYLKLLEQKWMSGNMNE